MNLDALALFQTFLTTLGLDAAAIEAWVEKFKADHPDGAGMADAFLAWLTPKITAAGTIQAANAAAHDLLALLQTGKGAISSPVEPTDLA